MLLGETDKGKRGTEGGIEVIESNGDVRGGRTSTGRSEVGGGREAQLGSRVEFAANEHLRLLI